MLKSGLIGAGVGFIYVMSLTLLSPLCTLCLVPFLGLGVGFLASWFDQPKTLETNLGRGVVAGGITGIGITGGQILATVVSGILVTNLNDLPATLGELDIFQSVIINPDQYWQTTLTVGVFCSMFNLALVTGLSALGSFLWYQRCRDGLLEPVSP